MITKYLLILIGNFILDNKNKKMGFIDNNNSINFLSSGTYTYVSYIPAILYVLCACTINIPINNKRLYFKY